MNIKDFFKKNQDRAHWRGQVRKTTRVKRVLGLLVGKKLLLAPEIAELPNVTVRIEDVLWVAENIEPRVLEVFPAALIHYPKSFLGLDKLPLELRKIIDDIRLGRAVDGMYNGIEIKKMVFWANFQLPDRRTKPLNEHRQMKTFRFRPATVVKIKQVAAKKGVSETALLESLIEVAE